APEVCEQLVVACCDPPELLEFGEEALDEVSFLVDAPVASMRTPSFGPRRNDGNSSGIENGVVEVLGVIGAIGDDVAGFEAVQQVLAIDHVAPMARREHEAHRQAERIDKGMDLGA